HDDGRTWGEPRVAVAAPPDAITIRGPALCLLPSGELLLGCLVWHEDRTTTWTLYRMADASAQLVPQQALWTRAPEQWRQGSVPHLLRLRSGRLVLPIQGGGG